MYVSSKVPTHTYTHIHAREHGKHMLFCQYHGSWSGGIQESLHISNIDFQLCKCVSPIKVLTHVKPEAHFRQKIIQGKHRNILNRLQEK